MLSAHEQSLGRDAIEQRPAVGGPPPAVAGGIEAVEPYARKVMVNTATSWWRRKWRGERPTAAMPERSHADGAEQWLERETVTRAFRKVLDRETAARAAADTLTPREIEIVRMVAQGLRNRAIAERLSISEGTVKVHLHNIYEKLAVDGRVELLLSARQKGLI